MDYAHIIQAADITGSSPVAQGIQHFHVAKKDNKETLLEIQDEIEKAKAFLSIPSSTSNVTLFDHLAAVLAKIIREKVENAVDVIENISHSIKTERYSKSDVKTTLIEKAESNEKLLAYIKDMQELFKSASEQKDVNLDIKPPEDDEDEPPEEEDIPDDDLTEADAENLKKKEEFNLRNVIPDLSYHMHYLREAGVGLSCSEILRINMSLKTLAVNLKLESVRFWGKICGLYHDYYIAETSFKEGIKQEEFGWRSSEKHSIDIVKPESDIEDEAAPQEETSDADVDVEDEETEKPELKYVTIPPLPQLKPPTFDFPPADKNGTGVNMNLYFVCTEPGYPWICLPRCHPEQIIAARQTKKLLSGKLNEEVRGYPLFPGKEAHYLRAQIARISAGTNLCPKNYYITSVKPEIDEDQETKDEEAPEEETPEKHEETSDMFTVNPDYQAPPVNEMFLKCVEEWVHATPAILQEGCSSLNFGIKVDSVDEATEIEAKDEEQEETTQEEKSMEKADQDDEIIKDKQIQLLRCISQDKCGGGLVPWTFRLCSDLMTELAVLLLRSNVWPGAYTYYNGKSFENIYIGFGQKYSTRHFAPVFPSTHAKEYPYGADITEHDYSVAPAEEPKQPEEQTSEPEGSES